MLRVANEASIEELDVDAALNRRAAENIVDTRNADGPFETLSALDAVSYVGVSTLRAILAYAHEMGYVLECSGNYEVGMVSDLDKTVIPPHDYTGSLPDAPYAGVAALYNALEFRENGLAGDFYYVTARTADMVVDIPAWLADHGLPAGRIETGVSDYWEAQAEKVRDISSILDTHPGQSFILFGDTSHRDPEVYREIIDLYPGRIIAVLVHKATQTVSENRILGLHLYHHYAEAAAILFGLGELDEDTAREVMRSAQQTGLEITDAEIETLIDEHR